MDAMRGPVRYRGTARDRLCWTIPASPSTPPCHCRREGHGARGHAPGGCGATPARRPGSGQKEGPEPRRTPPRISTANARSSGAPAVLQPTRSARTRPVAWSTAPSRCQHRGTGRGFAPAQTTPLRLGCSRRRTSHPPASQWNRGCASGYATREDRLVAGERRSRRPNPNLGSANPFLARASLVRPLRLLPFASTSFTMA